MSYQPPAGGGGYTTPPAAAAPAQTNVLAIISLVVGILGLLTLCTFIGFIPLLLGIVAAGLGFVARNQIKQQGQGGSGLAMAGLIIGAIAAILGLLELLGLAALIGFGGTAVSQLATQVSATLTAGP